MHKLHRRDLDLFKAEVENVLPQYFKSDYPELISFLNAYYETLQNNEDGFTDIILNSLHARDLYETYDYLYKLLMPELTLGTDITEVLSDSRLKGHLLANYYRKKGSLHGFKEFFRWLLDEDVQIEYTKKNMFLLNDPDSRIGNKSFRYIKNDKLYQTFAFLIKSGRTVSTWRDMYKQYCHPAGFYFEGSVVLQGMVDINIDDMPINVRIDFISLDPQAADFDTSVESSVTALYADSIIDDGSELERARLDITIQSLSELTVETLELNYNTLYDIISADSPTFDMYNEIDFASDKEKFDQTTFNDNV